ncbi:AAA family ATPase [Deinococcus sp. JMULE3]|uniref:ATP-binding protein n=1 Tax=Deinococcus sp. JMULE3 TaxID=2518341 RepID=UPI0015767530|nr:AAA family ATPase [Deinococcus sp. JMULE3]NTY02592.1 AAA family ATPase [Deinococcus sp. JMULE3]
MTLTHVFAQFRIPADTLAHLPEPTRKDLERAAQGGPGDWTRDAHGNLHAAPIPLPTPGRAQRTLTVQPDFAWPDAATHDAARRAAQLNLLACDLTAEAPRGDVKLRQVSLLSDLSGDPLPLYAAVPRAVVAACRQELRLAFAPQATDVRAYRVIPGGETVRAITAEVVTRLRDHRLHRVRAVTVHDLEVTGAEHVTVTRRAAYAEGLPPAPTLAASDLVTATQYALSVPSPGPYGVIDGCPPAAPSAASGHDLKRITQPPAPARPATQTTPASAPSPAAPTPTRPPEPPAAAPPEPTAEQADLDPVPAQAPLTPDAAADTAYPPRPAPDPWATLPDRVAVDPDVLLIARRTLERARPLLLTGPPGVGKTLLATCLAEALCGPGNYTLITADARWTASDVLGGLRVQPGDTLRYAFTPGVVTRAAERHRQSMATAGRPHALIIDEFNRAPQDEAFGQLLTLLDPAYRSHLPLVTQADGAPADVHLPADFILMGTMNDADQDRLHRLSAALRRRFTLLPLRAPTHEPEFLTRRFPTYAAALDHIYRVIGRPGQPGGLRAHQPIGTALVSDILGNLDARMDLDSAISAALDGQLDDLTNEQAELVAEPLAGTLPRTAALLRRCASWLD